MNRLLALAAVVASLGTGCVSSDTCDAHTVWVSWPEFTRVSGNSYETVQNTCYSDFDRMNVWVDGEFASAPCNDGAIPYTLLTGTHDVRVEAVDVDGVPIVRDVRQVSVSDSCSDQEAPTAPGESYVNLKYAVPSNVCDQGFGGTPSFMWFSVYDTIWKHTIAEVSQARPITDWTSVTCDAANGAWFILPEGDFVLQKTQELVRTSASLNSTSDLAVSSANCTPKSFSTVSGVDKQVNVTLTEGLSCP